MKIRIKREELREEAKKTMSGMVNFGEYVILEGEPVEEKPKIEKISIHQQIGLNKNYVISLLLEKTNEIIDHLNETTH